MYSELPSNMGSIMELNHSRSSSNILGGNKSSKNNSIKKSKKTTPLSKMREHEHNELYKS